MFVCTAAHEYVVEILVSARIFGAPKSIYHYFTIFRDLNLHKRMTGRPAGRPESFLSIKPCLVKHVTVVTVIFIPEPADLKAAEALDKNGDGVLTEKEQAAAGQYIRGDVNRDGKVNAVDLSLLKQVLLGSERTDIDRKAADWNEDEAINAEDANGILAFLLQKEM